jgi:hypothetical protein
MIGVGVRFDVDIGEGLMCTFLPSIVRLIRPVHSRVGVSIVTTEVELKSSESVGVGVEVVDAKVSMWRMSSSSK